MLLKNVIGHDMNLGLFRLRWTYSIFLVLFF